MERIHQLADEIRETFAERGWKIEKALELDGAFVKNRRSRSSLGRDLVLDAIDEATSRLGLGCAAVSGGAYDVVDVVDGADRRFRVRKADENPETGGYDIIASESILTVTDAEPDSLFRAERWVLGYTVDDDGMIVDIFAAPVLGATQDAVPRLILGHVTTLGHSSPLAPPPGTGFDPADEDDLGSDFDQDGRAEDTGDQNAG